jgi:glycosyltransferase involved in cell wall biosynthesis
MNVNLRNTLLNQSTQEKYQESQFEDSDSYSSQLSNSDLLISVIIPVYNEEYSIKSVIERIPNHLKYEIILVDDGSTDRSVLKIKEIEKDNIKILQHQQNLGYGAALITGFKNATGNIIVTLDSDGQHKPEEIEKMIKPILQDKADLVIGSRYLGDCDYKVPLYTRIGEYCVKICILGLFRQRVGNNQSGYRCFRKEILNVLNDNLFVRMGFTTEFLLECALNNLKILEIPISINQREHGTSNINLANIFKSILNCIAIYFLKRSKLKINTSFVKNSINTILKLLYRIKNPCQ